MAKVSVVLGGVTGLLSASGGACFSTPQQPQLRASSDASSSHSVPRTIEGESFEAHASQSSSAGQGAVLGLGCCSVLAATAGRQRLAAPRGVQSAIVCQAFNAAGEIGAGDPLLFWDPIGFCEGGTKEDFDRRRAVELKHGRVCMFATIGMLWPDVFGKWDGYISPSAGLKFSEIPSGWDAIYKVPTAGWVQILLVAGLIETKLFGDKSFGGFGLGSYGAEPGNFGTGYWGRKIKDPAERRSKLTAELNNGRLAMIAFTGMVVQNGLTGQSPWEQLASGHISPFNDGQGLFAVARSVAYDASKELGACPPLGYWDPFGMMAFGDKAKFERNRLLELKHGRICMVAAIGLLVPDLFGKFDGFLSPSMGLRYDQIPSSIQAIYKVPLEGWLQILAFIGAIEAKNLYFPADYGYPPFLGGVGKLQGAARDSKLLAEINNGRLAMMAVAAMVAQNGVTGQTLVEQFSTGNLNPFIGGYATPLRAVGGQSIALPWAPAPEGLSNNPLDEKFIGDVGFDPLGFAKNKRLLPWYREAELAHGRLCMMAILGFIVQTAGVKIEPFITRYPTSSTDALKAATQVPIVGWLQIIIPIALTELWRYENVISKYDSGVNPGDLGWNTEAPVTGPRPKWFGPTFTAKYSKEEYQQLRLREIKHARFAMVAFGYMAVQNAITGRTPTLVLNLDKPEYVDTVGYFVPIVGL